ncbi:MULTISPECIES: hypothetical protein [unclassified Janthinobacterium]|uniref:hypothetical protein n=1 Tax=Janthinobacterium sp. MP5059B TaxID=1766683 RepID=UPI0020C80B3F|nr:MULTISPECIES: hypothetical protein [unclassified Janthinobacterium]
MLIEQYRHGFRAWPLRRGGHIFWLRRWQCDRPWHAIHTRDQFLLQAVGVQAVEAMLAPERQHLLGCFILPGHYQCFNIIEPTRGLVRVRAQHDSKIRHGSSRIADPHGQQAKLPIGKWFLRRQFQDSQKQLCSYVQFAITQMLLRHVQRRIDGLCHVLRQRRGGGAVCVHISRYHKSSRLGQIALPRQPRQAECAIW